MEPERTKTIEDKKMVMVTSVGSEMYKVRDKAILGVQLYKRSSTALNEDDINLKIFPAGNTVLTWRP